MELLELIDKTDGGDADFLREGTAAGAGVDGSGVCGASMTAAEVRWRLLVLAAEDYASLVEALWEFGLPDAPLPGAPDPHTVRNALRALVVEGLVDLYWCEEVYGELEPLPPWQRLAVFDDDGNWRVFQEGERGVRFSTSPAGDDAVRRRPADVPADLYR